MTINHIGKHAEGNLIANEIRYEFQPRFCCTLNKVLPWLGVAVLIAGIAVVINIGIHPAP